MNQNYYKDKVANGQIMEAIEDAIDISKKNNYPILNLAIGLKNRLAEINRKETAGTIGFSESQTAKNKIADDFMQLIDNYNNEAFRRKDQLPSNNNWIKIGIAALAVISILLYFLFGRGINSPTINSDNNSGNNVIIGDDNTDNNVIIGNNNTVQIEEHRDASTSTIPFAISVDNDFLNLTAKEEESVELFENDESTQIYIEPRGEKLTYDISYNGDILNIHPNLNYLNLFREKGPITEKEDMSGGGGLYFLTQYPNLDLRLVNNSDETIFFERAEFRVEKSRIDPEPLIIIKDMEDRAVSFKKESWGELTNCYIAYNIYPIDINDYDYENTAFKKNVEGINGEYFASVSIENALIELGYDNEKVLATGFFAEMETLPARLEAMGQVRPVKALPLNDFKNEYEFWIYYNRVNVAGRLHYTWINKNGKPVEDYVKFHNYVILNGDRGAAGPSSFQYRTMLRTEGKNYTVSEKISQYIKPNEIDRFHFLVGAEKSTLHKLKLRLYYNSGKFIESNPIDLKIFFPRSSKQLLDDLKENNKKGKIKNEAKSKELKVWVSRLNVREAPDLNAEVIHQLNRGTVINFAGEVSKEKVKVRLGGNYYTDYFYKITTAGGKSGWVHGGALR